MNSTILNTIWLPPINPQMSSFLWSILFWVHLKYNSNNHEVSQLWLNNHQWHSIYISNTIDQLLLYFQILINNVNLFSNPYSIYYFWTHLFSIIVVYLHFQCVWYFHYVFYVYCLDPDDNNWYKPTLYNSHNTIINHHHELNIPSHSLTSFSI